MQTLPDFVSHMVILSIFSDRAGNDHPKDELLHITTNNKILNITFKFTVLRVFVLHLL